MTFSEPSAHSSPLFHDLKLLNFADLHELLMNAITIFVYECHNNFAPSHFADYFTQTSHIHSHNTRSAARGDFFMVRKNTLQYGLRSISFNGAKIWNNIPPEIRDSPSVRTFKNKLKNFLLDSYIS